MRMATTTVGYLEELLDRLGSVCIWGMGTSAAVMIGLLVGMLITAGGLGDNLREEYHSLRRGVIGTSILTVMFALVYLFVHK